MQFSQLQWVQYQIDRRSFKRQNACIRRKKKEAKSRKFANVRSIDKSIVELPWEGKRILLHTIHFLTQWTTLTQRIGQV